MVQHDLWEGRACSQAFPQLFSFAKNQHVSLKVAGSTPLHQTLFHFPLSTEAYAHFQELFVILQNLQSQPVRDVWSYIWGSSFWFTRAYKHLLATVLYTEHTSGCGNQTVRTRESSSFGLS